MGLLLHKGNESDKQNIIKHTNYLKTLAKLATIDWVKDNQIPPSASAIAGSLELHIVISEANLAAEKLRLQKELEKIKKDITLLANKLSNLGYTSKAPQEIVAKDQARLTENQELLAKLQAQLDKMR